ncbi:MAG: hypothetical protein HKN79_06760, partial [Flavobacteriales bacterium]|nr:hypothetical protein [Flavobacteriales bacterium]
MKSLLTGLMVVFATTFYAQGGMVTFSVDMSGYTGSEILTDSNVYVNGTFNDWCGACWTLGDSDADMIYTGTFPVTSDTIEYKFTVNGWTDQENFVGGEECTISAFGFTNRYLTYSGDTTLTTVCWNSCSPCGVGPDPGNVTLTVDMNTYAGSETIGDSSMYVSGAFNNWCGDCNMMSHNGDGTYTTTVAMGPGLNEYKFQINQWADQEYFNGSEPCTGPPAEFINRQLMVDGDTIVGEVCFQACVTCDLAQDPGNITLSVDMNQYEGPEIVGDSSVFVSGQFNSWCGDCNMLTHNGDGTYTGTVLMPAGQNEYKFQINNWADDESLVGGEECTLTTGEFTNRVLDVNGDAIVDMVCFESCAACAAPCTLADTAPVGLTKSQQPVPFPDGDIDRAQVKWYKDTPDVKYSADDNTAVDIEFWPIRDLVTNTPITNGDTTLLLKRTKPNKDLFKWPVKYIRPDINPNTRYRWRVRIYCDAGN